MHRKLRVVLLCVCTSRFLNEWMENWREWKRDEKIDSRTL